MPLSLHHFVGLCTLSLVGLTTACDSRGVSENIELDDAAIVSRSADFDCASWRNDRPVSHRNNGDIDIGLGFAQQAFDDGFAGLRSCEQTSYDQDAAGNWVVTDTAPGDLTYELGLRTGDRNVKARSIDSVTGDPTGPWVPIAFPHISALTLLEMSAYDDFEVKAKNPFGITKKFKVHLDY
ncbi:MAG: hypothetical protein AAF799_37415 [Myxococcota bacterium]